MIAPVFRSLGFEQLSNEIRKRRRDAGPENGGIPVWNCPDFLVLPNRDQKPRNRGITHVLDKGMPIPVLDALLAEAGPWVDILKIGWGIGYLDPMVERRVEVCAAAGVTACLGGTLLEICAAQGKIDELRHWAADIGIGAIEVSNGLQAMTSQAKTELVASLSTEFIVLAETGTKDDATPVVVADWIAEMAADLAAGARWVIAEGRESGTVGLYDSAGVVRGDLADAIVDELPVERVIFEAPLKAQQVWFVRRLGPAANLGNVPPEETLALETLRVGLRADTAVMGAHL
jgi:phosphosulfolactate synthase